MFLPVGKKPIGLSESHFIQSPSLNLKVLNITPVTPCSRFVTERPIAQRLCQKRSFLAQPQTTPISAATNPVQNPSG
ncbi:MAG: hypothetical protein ACI8Z0_002391, partial [Lentimonas sp.]